MSFEEWPVALMEAYEKLNLPSFYDFVLANEKLSVEVKKQNKDLKSLYGIVQKLQEEFSLLQNQEDFEKENGAKGYEDLLKETYEAKKKEDQTVIIQTVDSMKLFVEALNKTVREISEHLQPKKFFFFKKLYHKEIKEKLTTIQDGAALSYKKLFSALTDLGLEQILPQQGDPFSPSLHRAIDTAKGGVRGTICETIRSGYKSKENILRYADVIIYLGG